MVHCFVKGCKTDNSKKLEGISFFRIPAGANWLPVIGRSADTKINYQRICSLHFTRNEISNSGGSYRSTLVKNSMPRLLLPNNRTVLSENIDFVPNEEPTKSTVILQNGDNTKKTNQKKIRNTKQKQDDKIETEFKPNPVQTGTEIFYDILNGESLAADDEVLEKDQYFTVQEKTPFYNEVEEETSLCNEAEKETPLYNKVIEETPVCNEVVEETSLYGEVLEDTPIYNEPEEETPFYNEKLLEDTPIYNEAEEETPLYNEVHRKVNVFAHLETNRKDNGYHCRLCSQWSGKTIKMDKIIKEMLVDCFSFMAPFVKKEYKICEKCFSKLQISYFFKHTCLKAMDLLRIEINLIKKKSTVDNAENMSECDDLDEEKLLNKAIKLSEISDNDLDEAFEEIRNHTLESEKFNKAKRSITNKQLDDHVYYKISFEEENLENEEINENLISDEENHENSEKSEITQKIQCPDCLKMFKNKINLRRHKPKCKKEPELKKDSIIYSCKYCDWVFVSHSEYQDHFKTNRNQPFHCKSCCQSFSHMDLLKNHMKEVHKLMCDICDKRYDTQEEFMAHWNRHTKPTEVPNTPEPKTEICQICGKSVLYYGINRHIELVHNNELVSCKICNKSLKKDSLRMHIKARHEPKKINCPICGKLFAKKTNMLLHTEIHKTAEKNIRCEFCNKMFTSNRKLYQHNMSVHKYDFKCDYCSKKFVRRESYNKHIKMNLCIRRKEKSGMLKPVKCDICKKVLSSQYALKYHLLTHKNEPKECTICHKTYKHERMLALHMKYHEQKFVCDFCGFVSSNSVNLRKHKQTHEDSKPHRCNVCWEKFGRLEELKEHAVKHSNNGSGYVCSMCGEHFNRAYLLDCHINVKHRSEIVKSYF